MDKATFIEALRSGRKQWDDLLAQIDQSRMLESMEEGGWSVKDTIVHITWNEREMIGFCQQHALVSPDLWNLPQDERNARPVEEQRDVPLSDILAESEQVYAQLLEAIQTLSDEDLNDARRFRGLREGTPWEMIAGCSFDHYPGHIAVIRRWLDRSA